MIGDADENFEMDQSFALERWIGYTDAAEEGVFRWINGAASTFNAWPGGTPPVDEALDCAVLRDGSGLWSTVGCDELRRYACECDPLPP